MSPRPILRSLRRAPWFTGAVVLTLTLGIGATAAVFSVVDAVLLRPLPYADAGRLVVLGHALTGIGIPKVAQSLGTFYHYRHTSRTLASIAGYQSASVNLSDPGGTAEAERVDGSQISANLLPTLGVAPELGRGFVDADQRPDARVALIGDDLWRRRFAADASILSREARINGDLYRIVGIMPPGFHYPNPTTELWRPLQLDSLTPHAGGFNIGAVARLAPGATAASAQAELNHLLARISESYPDVFPRMPMDAFLRQSQARATVVPMRDAIVGDFARALWIVAATVLILLVVTCANVANLLLVRAQGRVHELAVRSALGATRARLIAAFFAETALLAIAGGVLGTGLAAGATKLLVATGPANFPRLAEVRVDATTIAFTMVVVAIVVLLCGTLPALRFRATQIGAMLREGGRSGTGGRTSHRTQRTLIVVQVALGLVLLAGSGLLARTVQHLRAVKPGFDPAGSIAFTLSLPSAEYPHNVDVARFYDAVIGRLRTLPGVTDVGLVSKLPLVGGETLTPVYLEHFPVSGTAVPPVFPAPVASAGYFRAMRIPLIAGRLFPDPNDPEGANEVLVSRAFAERFWHDPTGRRALGERMRINDAGRMSTIVGVVESVRDTSLEAAPVGEVYFPLSVPAQPVPDSVAPITIRVMTVVLRTAGDPAALGPAVRREIAAMDPTIPVYDLQPLTQVLARAMARTRFVLLALAAAAAITLILAAVGLYGVIAYVVSLRTRELGLRIALGAEPRGVLGLVLRDGVGLAAIGVVAGLLAFAAAARSLRGLLFGIGPADPLTLTAVSCALLVVAMVSSLVPAWRASRIDPLEALRAD